MTSILSFSLLNCRITAESDPVQLHGLMRTSAHACQFVIHVVIHIAGMLIVCWEVVCMHLAAAYAVRLL